MGIIGFTYDADIHCVDCTYKRFPYGTGTARDSEDNPVHPVFVTDEVSEPEDGCGTCGAPLE